MIRPATIDDAPFMWDMLWEAAAISDEMKALGKATALRRPQVAKYLNEWGWRGDAGCLFLNDRNEPVGSAWYRLFPRENPGYGFVAEDIPELTIGVLRMPVAGEQEAPCSNIFWTMPGKKGIPRSVYRLIGIIPPATSTSVLDLWTPGSVRKRIAQSPS